MRPYRLSQLISTLVQLSYYPALWSGAIYQGVTKQFCVPILTCWGCPLMRFGCPMGALQYFIGVREFPFYILGFFVFIGATVGRMACAWLCPFGLLQDLLKKITKIKLSLPNWTTYIKYLVLIVIGVIAVYITQEPWFCKLCPAGMLEAGLPLVLADQRGDLKALVGWLFKLKLGILLGVILGSIFIKRFFCRVLCPIGAIYSVFNRISILQMKTDSEKCGTKKCNLCRQVCPMDINIYENPKAKECIRCLECKHRCPKVAVGVGFK
ncbi:MAG: 4Fe-4S binding protein [candidate division WOR-3 bacterium]|nr:4Fe-4S binding protein [candidate division WOR-3 bacterium]MDW7987768.1 4Fe-4S binding protein [candidate division WOR-3 bacterium]